MKVYNCDNCGNTLYFENSVCLNCGYQTGFDSRDLSIKTLKAGYGREVVNIIDPGAQYFFCINFYHNTCNWLMPKEANTSFCVACSLNRTIPSLITEENKVKWANIEKAKHRLVYSLLRLGLPVSPKKSAGDSGIAFDFVADLPGNQKVITGHADGVITLNIEEADESLLAKHKLDLGERYRTLLGHFRHEIGHYYWELLIKDKKPLMRYRELFGDERKDYGASLDTYYQDGAPPDWNARFISPYASAHPWEDWAETWAHYLHLMDTLQTASSVGIGLQAKTKSGTAPAGASPEKDPYEIADFKVIFNQWIPLTFAVNSLNRSMGHEDFYPFIISAPVIEKLAFIHELCLPFRKREVAVD
jgi:hypothetical protein